MLHPKANLLNRRALCKAIWLVFLLVGAALAAVGQRGPSATPRPAASVATDITIELNNYANDTVMLAYHFGDKQYLRDTLRVHNGSVRLQYAPKLPSGVYMLVLRPANTYFEFVVNEPKFTLAVDVADPIQSMRVTGSTENQVFFDFQRYSSAQGKLADSLSKKYRELQAAPDTSGLGKLGKRIQDIYSGMDAYRREQIRRHPNTFMAKLFGFTMEPEVPEPPAGADSTWKYYYYRSRFFPPNTWENADIVRTPAQVFHARLMRYFDKVLPQHSDSLAAEAVRIVRKTAHDTALFQFTLVTLLNKYSQSNIMCHEAVYVSLVDSFYRTGLARWVHDTTRQKMLERADALRPLRCHATAPDLTLWELSGQAHQLSMIDAEYTILYFYDPECGHCKKSSPKLARVHDHYKPYDVAWYAVCTAPDREKWPKFIEEHKMKGINVADIYGRTGYKNIYDVVSTPVVFILDRNKKIIAKKLAPEQVDEFLSRMLSVDRLFPPGTQPTEEAH